MILAFVLIHLLRTTGMDAYGAGAVWCSATAVYVLIRILRRVIDEGKH